MFNSSTRLWEVEINDTLSKIATVVYSDSRRSSVIFNANKSVIRNRNSLDNGLQLYIPILNDDATRTKIGGVLEQGNFQNVDDFLLTIDGKNIEFISGLKFREGQSEGIRTMAFSIPIEAAPDLKAFQKVDLFIRGVLFISGQLLAPEVIYDKESGHVLQWQATTKAYPVIHSQYKATKSTPSSWRNISLSTLFDTVLSGHPVSVIIKDPSIGLEKFEKVGFDGDETIFQFIKRVANQKKYSIRGMATGDFELYQTPTFGLPVGKFNDSSQMNASYDYEGLASEYQVTNEKKGGGKIGTATNSFIPFNIFKSSKEDSSNSGDLNKLAAHMQSMDFAAAVSLSITTEFLFNDSGVLWQSGDYVSIIAVELGITSDTTFVVDAPEFDLSDGGTRTHLSLTYPEFKRGEMPQELPFL